MAQAQQRSVTEAAIGVAEDTVRASIDVAMKVAQAGLEAGSDAARRVDKAMREALDAVSSDGGGRRQTP